MGSRTYPVPVPFEQYGSPTPHVIPAKAGIHSAKLRFGTERLTYWIPAFAGMTCGLAWLNGANDTTTTHLMRLLAFRVKRNLEGEATAWVRSTTKGNLSKQMPGCSSLTTSPESVCC